MKNIYYKVVTKNHQSLGLRKNPTILTFKLNKWVISPDIKTGKSDDGGIWVARNLGGAKTLKKYMKNKYNKDCLIYLTEIDTVLYENSYRIKTNKVKLLEKII